MQRFPGFLFLLIFSLSGFFSSTICLAEDEKKQLPIPRFVSLKSDETNVRRGPGLRYQIKFVLTRKAMPVEVVAEFEQWRKIREIGGGEGWVHTSMLKAKRTGIVIGEKSALHTLHAEPDKASPAILKVESGVQAEVKSCRKSWCKLKIENDEAWLEKPHLWGVYPEEEFNGR